MLINEENETWLNDSIDSVKSQLYENWELYLAGKLSKVLNGTQIFKNNSNNDNRIKTKHITSEQNQYKVLNAVLNLTKGKYLGLLGNNDKLSVDALYENIKALNDDPELNLIYSDEDLIDISEKRQKPLFKPDFSPDFILSQNFLGNFCLIKKNVIKEIGGYREDYEGDRNYDLILRCIEKTEISRIHHIPKILYHKRISDIDLSNNETILDYDSSKEKKALIEYVKRNNIDAEVSNGLVQRTFRVKRKVNKDNKVSIIIPFKDKVDILRECLNSIINLSTFSNFEIVLINNASRETETHDYLKSLKHIKCIKFINYQKLFNFSAINNHAVAQVDSGYIIFLNNDTKVISPDWIESMLEFAQRKEIGAVGAKLYYPDGSIQHGGIVVGIGGAAGHIHRFRHKSYNGYLNCLKTVRNVSAITAACMMVRKEVFDEVRGFDENIEINFGDVDLCLRILKEGYQNIFTPFAELVHHEKASRASIEKTGKFEKELLYFNQKWTNVINNGDSHFNINIPLLDEASSDKFIEKICEE